VQGLVHELMLGKYVEAAIIAAAKCRRSVAYYCSAAYTSALISLEKMKIWRGHFSRAR
jgi:hypothetical protein